jgi:predicted deacetylase|tara:strand:+ start:2136 stop:2849 length:714 start_codon:yes stop_codon:yes gene_type:complete
MQNLINISIDDVSPHPKSSTKVLDRCYELIALFPDIKFTLFVPISYWRTTRPDISTKEPLQINFFPDFCNDLKQLNKNNFEICFHGYHHGIPGKSDNDELQNLSYNEAIDIIDSMRKVVALTCLKDDFKPIIRPPAWRMSGDAIKAFRDKGFKVFALTDLSPWVETYQNEHLKVNDVVNFSSCPPFRSLILKEKSEIVYHACEWDSNFLNNKMTSELINFLHKNKGEYEFSFIAGLL